MQRSSQCQHGISAFLHRCTGASYNYQGSRHHLVNTPCSYSKWTKIFMYYTYIGIYIHSCMYAFMHCIVACMHALMH